MISGYKWPNNSSVLSMIKTLKKKKNPQWTEIITRKKKRFQNKLIFLLSYVFTSKELAQFHKHTEIVDVKIKTYCALCSIDDILLTLLFSVLHLETEQYPQLNQYV